jgi:hypothetical protein
LLTKELELKNRKIENLHAEMKELQEMKLKRDEAAKRQLETSIDEVILLRNVARSKKSRE